MKLVFGLELDASCFGGAAAVSSAGIHHLGPDGLLDLLETTLGLVGPSRENEFLRIEAFRQICRKALDANGGDELFFARSFVSDDFGTAADLLKRYEELLLANWKFEIEEGLPERLRTMAHLHELARAVLPLGKVARLLAVEEEYRRYFEAQQKQQWLFEEVRLVEPLDLLPPFWRRLLPLLGPVKEPQTLPVEHTPTTDLEYFRCFLSGSGVEKKEALADGSLMILQLADLSEAASYVAALFKENADYRPLCLVPDLSSRLDFAMVKEGLPSLGLQSVSLARPGLQLLKLAPAFLWEPMDPYKLMEFVSLPLKPLDTELAQVIARELAEAPGLRGERWRRSIAVFFENREKRSTPRQMEALRRQYNFWFVRQRYELQSKAPKKEIIEIFTYLMRWSREAFEKGSEKQQSLLVLHTLARQLVELLEYLPEEALTALALERLVRTVYQPSPVQFRVRERGSPDSVHHPAAVATEVEDLLWWDFTENEPPSFFSSWYPSELSWLCRHGVFLETPDLENRRWLYQQQLPVWKATKRLVLVLPRMNRGSVCSPHPLMSELRVAFGESLSRITFEPGGALPSLRYLPALELLEPKEPVEPQLFLHFSYKDWLGERVEESFSSVEDLLYYPHKWFFRYGLKLRKSPIFSIVAEETLMGRLAHRFFEQLLNEDCFDWSRKQLNAWVDRCLLNLLQSEGAVLLMYGKEPERVRFLRRMKQAAWFLIQQLKENKWRVKATEMPLEGKLLSDVSVKGVADLVLERGEEQAVLDLKWRGLGYRRDLIKNEEDLQLVMYARLLPPPERWAYTAFFILDKVELLARTRHAFRQIRPLAGEEANPDEVNERIWRKLVKTFAWRRAQLRQGKVELRTELTAEKLDSFYNEAGVDLMDFLEMKREDAGFDDYRVLMSAFSVL